MGKIPHFGRAWPGCKNYVKIVPTPLTRGAGLSAALLLEASLCQEKSDDQKK